MDPSPSAVLIAVLLAPAVLIFAALTVAELRKRRKTRVPRVEPARPSERVPAGAGDPS